MSRHSHLRKTAPEPGAAEPTALHQRALENLRYIRDTMDRSAAFTAVSGVGFVAAGATAVAAAWLTAERSGSAWLVAWLVEAAIGLTLSATFTLRKAARAGAPLTRGAGRKFILGFAPPTLAAIVLTPALFVAGAEAVVPGTWMLLYGAGITTAGAFSARAVPAMGVAFMLVGALALAFPAGRDAWLALGFGGIHVVFGVLIARSHGG